MNFDFQQVIAPAMNTGVWVGLSVVITLIALTIYMAITPYDELKLIRAGNKAAAFSLGGALVGMVLPLAAVILYTHKVMDLLIWGTMGLVIQLVVFALIAYLLHNPRRLMEEGNEAVGILLGAGSLAAGIITAVCLVP